MASGATHERITQLATPFVAASAFWHTADAGLAVAAGVGCWLGIYLSPDLDICGMTRSENQVRRHFGKVAGWLFWSFWYPYGRLLRHRSFLSHAPLIGTGGRLVYMLWPCIFVTALLDYSGIVPLNFAAFWGNLGSSAVFWWAVRGLAASDILHFIADYW
jgi:uncharacterized metal-binding protein